MATSLDAGPYAQRNARSKSGQSQIGAKRLPKGPVINFDSAGNVIVGNDPATGKPIIAGPDGRAMLSPYPNVGATRPAQPQNNIGAIPQARTNVMQPQGNQAATAPARPAPWTMPDTRQYANPGDTEARRHGGIFGSAFNAMANAGKPTGATPPPQGIAQPPTGLPAGTTWGPGGHGLVTPQTNSDGSPKLNFMGQPSTSQSMPTLGQTMDHLRGMAPGTWDSMTPEARGALLRSQGRSDNPPGEVVDNGRRVQWIGGRAANVSVNGDGSTTPDQLTQGEMRDVEARYAPKDSQGGKVPFRGFATTAAPAQPTQPASTASPAPALPASGTQPPIHDPSNYAGSSISTSGQASTSIAPAQPVAKAPSAPAAPTPPLSYQYGKATTALAGGLADAAVTGAENLGVAVKNNFLDPVFNNPVRGALGMAPAQNTPQAHTAVGQQIAANPLQPPPSTVPQAPQQPQGSISVGGMNFMPPRKKPGDDDEDGTSNSIAANPNQYKSPIGPGLNGTRTFTGF